MTFQLKPIIDEVDKLTKVGHYHPAMALVAESLQGLPEDSADAKELREALVLLEQMAQMSQFAEELGVGPGGAHSQEYSPDWETPKDA